MTHISRSSNIFGALALCVADRLHDLELQSSELAAPSEALVHLSHCTNPTIESLSKALNLSHSAAVRLADRLERARLVIRMVAAADRRAVALKLTKKGSQRASSLLARRSTLLTDLFEQAGSAEERKTFLRMAEHMLKSLTADGAQLYRNCRLCDFAACSDCPVADSAR